MQLRKNFVTLLAGISLLCCGMFIACENPSNVANENENQNEDAPEGIVLTWGNVTSDVKSVRIDTMIGDWSYTVFQINDLTKYKSITDKYVTKGKDYKYRIVTLDENGNGITWGDWFTVTAEGGSGELDFSATATSTGVKLASTADVLLNKIDDMYIDKFKKSSEHVERIVVCESESDDSFIDTFVEPSSEYEYRFRIGFGHNSYTNDNDEKVPATPLVEYPRFKVAKVKATAGSGSIKATVLPKAEYNAEKKTITVTQVPQFSVTPKSWNMYINYSKQNNGTRTFRSFSSEDKGEKLTKEIYSYIPAGLWNFEECWFNLYFDNYEYSLGLYDLSDVPESIALNVNVEDLFIPTLTAKDEGIEISWDKSKLPAGTETVWINSSNHWFEISDLSITSVLDKYVESGKTYEYYIQACNKNGNTLLQSESDKEKATGGKGKLKIENENKITVSYDERAGAVAFSELPKLTDNPSEWNVYFEYNNNTGLFSISSSDKTLFTNLYDAPAGDWTFSSYYINDYSNPAYRYCQKGDNLEVFANFPEKITISDAYKPKLTATAVEDGVKLQWENLPAQTKKIQIEANNKFIDIYDLTLTSFVDNYVEPGKTYEYYIRVSNESGNTSVQSERVSVKATGGKGKFKIENTNKITVIYDAVEGEVTFSELPKLTDKPSEWSMNFNYQINKNNNWTLFGLYSGNNNLTRGLNDAPNGEWTFNGYWINDDSNSSYRYCQWEDNLDAFANFPEKITISDAYKPKLTASNVENGIKFQWENIPENPQYFAIYLKAKDDSSFIEYRINNKELTSFVAENVTAGKTYDCYLNIRKSNDNWINSNHVEFTPAKGLGEVLITNSPVAVLEGADKVSFTTVPQVSGLSSDINWTTEFRYTLGTNGGRGLYNYYSNQNDTISSINSWVENGTWSFKEYCVWFGTGQDDFEYFNYVYDISKLNGMPKQIVINKEN